MFLSYILFLILIIHPQWNELNRILTLDASHADHSCCSLSPEGKPPKSPLAPITAWTDAWRVYEDVCVICAGLWLGSWRGNSLSSYSTAEGSANWGAIRLEGDTDLSLRALTDQDLGHVRTVGMGIEGGPSVNARGKGKAAAAPPDSDSASAAEEEPYDTARRDGQILTTLSLLQTLHAHTSFQLSTLATLLRRPRAVGPDGILVLTPKDMALFELGPFSAMDARYLEWLGAEYTHRPGPYGSRLTAARVFGFEKSTED